MQNVLARDLEELRMTYSPAVIVAQIREFFEIQDGIGTITNAELFEHAIRDYCSYADHIEQEADSAYLVYLAYGQISLKVARCLLPNKLSREMKK